jgi:hypothetical protein
LGRIRREHNSARATVLYRGWFYLLQLLVCLRIMRSKYLTG